MARKPKLDARIQERICQAITMGATYEHAAGYGGIHYDTFNEWRKKYPAFSDAVKDAEARAVVGWLAKIEQAATTQWQAAAWKLERRYPQTYGRTVQEHQGRDGGPIQIDDVSLADDERLRRLRTLFDAAATPGVGPPPTE